MGSVVNEGRRGFLGGVFLVHPIQPRAFVVPHVFEAFEFGDLQRLGRACARATVEDDFLLRFGFREADGLDEVVGMELDEFLEGGHGHVDRGRDVSLDHLRFFAYIYEENVIARHVSDRLEVTILDIRVHFPRVV